MHVLQRSALIEPIRRRNSIPTFLWNEQLPDNRNFSGSGSLEMRFDLLQENREALRLKNERFRHRIFRPRLLHHDPCFACPHLRSARRIPVTVMLDKPGGLAKRDDGFLSISIPYVREKSASRRRAVCSQGMSLLRRFRRTCSSPCQWPTISSRKSYREFEHQHRARQRATPRAETDTIGQHERREFTAATSNHHPGRARRFMRVHRR